MSNLEYSKEKNRLKDNVWCRADIPTKSKKSQKKSCKIILYQYNIYTGVVKKELLRTNNRIMGFNSH